MTALGDVATFVRGINFKPDDVVPVGTPGSVACMRTKNVQSELDLSDVWGVSEAFVKRDDQYLQVGDILVSSANSWNLVGRGCWVPELPWRSSFGGFVSVLRADPHRVDRRFLFYWFTSSRIQALVRSFGQQTTNISNLNVERCLKLSLTLPPLSEQRRIAGVLDLSKDLRATRRDALAELDVLTQAIFLDMFTGGLDGPAIDVAKHRTGLPKGWSWELLTDVARLATGHTPDRENEDYWNGSIPWISLTDIRELDGTVAKKTIQNITQLGIDNSSSVLLPKGTVCFSRTASIGFVTVMGSEMATSQDFVNWTCGPRLDPTYLMWSFLCARRRLRELSSGSTHKTIYMRVVEQFYGLIPPIALQREFARRVAAIDDLKVVERLGVAELDSLFSSLQHSTLNGAM